MVSSVFMFTPMPGDMIQFDQDFSNGLKPPTRNCFDVLFFGRMVLKTLQLWNGKWKCWNKACFASKRGLIYIGGLFINLYKYWLVVSNIFCFHPYLGKIPILTNIFQLGWNHQLEYIWYQVMKVAKGGFNEYIRQQSFTQRMLRSCSTYITY